MRGRPPRPGSQSRRAVATSSIIRERDVRVPGTATVCWKHANGDGENPLAEVIFVDRSEKWSMSVRDKRAPCGSQNGGCSLPYDYETNPDEVYDLARFSNPRSHRTRSRWIVGNGPASGDLSAKADLNRSNRGASSAPTFPCSPTTRSKASHGTFQVQDKLVF